MSFTSESNQNDNNDNISPKVVIKSELSSNKKTQGNKKITTLFKLYTKDIYKEILFFNKSINIS